MAQTHLEVFPSEYHMLQFFGKYLPKLDVPASAKLAPFLYKYDGNFVVARSLYEFLNQMEELIALDINTRASTQKGKAFLVFFDKKPKDAEKFAANSSPEINKSENVIVVPQVEVSDVITTELVNPEPQETITHVVTDNPVTEPIVTEISVEESEKKEQKLAIMAEAESFRDDSKKAAAKAELEKFALDKGISLSKAKTFDDMLKDLEAAL